MNQARKERIGRNEALYRSINERIEDLNAAFGMVTETMSVVCECGRIDCTEQIELDIPAFERVRADSAQFVVVPGHEIPEVEDVVEEHDTFSVVRKEAETVELVEKLDERN